MKRDLFTALIGIVLGVAICNLFFHGCNKTKTTVEVQTVHDTTFLPVLDGGNIEASVPDTIIVYRTRTQVIKSNPWHIADSLMLWCPGTDTSGILKPLEEEFYSWSIYNDSFPIKYGTLYLSDSINQNRRFGLGYSLKQSIPLITDSVLITPKPRGQLYLGFNFINGQPVVGPQLDPLRAAGFSFLYRHKSGNIFEAGLYYGTRNTLFYTGGFKLPLTK